MKRVHAGMEITYENWEGKQGPMPEKVNDMDDGLQLLYNVPLSYLVPEPSYLPPESIRFFYVDGNFVKAMMNGALSVARRTKTDRMADGFILKEAAERSEVSSRQLRVQKVHENHRGQMVKRNTRDVGQAGCRTGFLLRSALVQRRKGIAVNGFQGQEPLELLRLETVAPDIMLGIFDGELTRLTIAEPSCGLRFGCRSDTGKNRVRSLKEPGKPVPEAYYDVKSNEKGRIDILAAVGQMEKALEESGEMQGRMSSGIFAYQFLQAAQKAEFLKKE